MRVAITGGGGFIGTQLCAALRHAHSVVVLDDLSARHAAVPADVEFVRGDILDPDALAAALAGADALVHLAARSSVSASMRDPVDTYRVNGYGTAAVLEAARRAGVGRAVLASSAAVYGEQAGPVAEDAPLQPVNPYGASKLAAEGCARSSTAAFGLPVLAMRLFNVFGPGQPVDDEDGAVVPRFVATALRDQPLPVHGDGSQTRDFVYVQDVCRLIVAALVRAGCVSGPMNVGSGAAVSLGRLGALIGDALGEPVRWAPRPARPGDVRASQAAVGRLARLFPTFTATPLAAALVPTVRWYAARQDVDSAERAAVATSRG